MSEFVKGQCPLCGSGVFVGSCGWLTCSGSECPDPLFVGEIFEKYKESNSNLGELMRIVKQLEAMTVPAPRLEAKFIPGEEVIYFGRRVLVDAVTFGHGFPVLYEIVDPADENQRHYDVAEHLLSPPVGTQE